METAKSVVIASAQVEIVWITFSIVTTYQENVNLSLTYITLFIKFMNFILD